jgi:hypothetical protein
MFNSREYKWSDIDIMIDGEVITKARGITYKVSKEKELVHARGEEPLDIVSGNKAYDGTLDILLSGLFAIQAKYPGLDLLDMNFEIVVSYVPKLGGAIVTKALKYAEFTEIEEGMKQGEKFKEVSIPIIFLGIV